MPDGDKSTASKDCVEALRKIEANSIAVLPPQEIRACAAKKRPTCADRSAFQQPREKAMNEEQGAANGSVARATRWPIVLVGMMLAMSVSFMPRASAQGGGADKILKAMSDYVTSQKTLSVTYDSDVEVITPALQKIQFTSSGQVQLSRPDKLRAAR